MINQSERLLRSQIAAHTSWANTADRAARTLPARRAMLDKFERQVDPGGALPPAERAIRAQHARKAHFARLALKSAQSRRRRGAIQGRGPNNRNSAGFGVMATEGGAA